MNKYYKTKIKIITCNKILHIEILGGETTLHVIVNFKFYKKRKLIIINKNLVVCLSKCANLTKIRNYSKNFPY